jgi:hypothetical protein
MRCAVMAPKAIGDGEDACGQRDLVGGQAKWVAAAVGALVVGDDPVADVVEAGLAQDGVRDADLADVVQESGEADALDLGGWQVQPASDELGVPGDCLRVCGGAVVAHVARFGEHHDRCDVLDVGRVFA